MFVPLLQQNFPNLGVSSLNVDETLLDATIMWIGNSDALRKLTTSISQLIAGENNVYGDYLKWVRPYGCCKKNGIDPDSEGYGIQPFAININSYLAFYRFTYPFELLLFPPAASNEYQFNRYKIRVYVLPAINNG